MHACTCTHSRTHTHSQSQHRRARTEVGGLGDELIELGAGEALGLLGDDGEVLVREGRVAPQQPMEDEEPLLQSRALKGEGGRGTPSPRG